jgi:hypothetical protein
MKLQVYVLLSICIIFTAAGVQQLDRPEGKLIAIGSISVKQIAPNQTNLTNLTGIIDNFSNQSHLNLSGLNATLLQFNNVNESVMETPSKACAQPDLNKREISSLGKDADKHEGY